MRSQWARILARKERRSPALRAAYFRAISWLPPRPAFELAAALGRRRFRHVQALVGSTVIAELAGVDHNSAERIAALSFQYATCDELEYALLPRIRRQNLERYLEIRGLDKVETALEAGRGAILYSGHVRGHYLFFGALGLLGTRPNLIGMPTDPDVTGARRVIFDRRDSILRDHMGCRFLNMKEDRFVAVRAIQALRSNAVVTVEIDHSHSEQNVATEFFGKTALFPVGPLLVAHAARAPLLPFWLHRPPTWRPQIAEIGDPVFVSDDFEESLRRVVKPLEEYIRQHPQSWAAWLFPDFRLFVEASQ